MAPHAILVIAANRPTAVWLALALAGCKIHTWGPGGSASVRRCGGKVGSETELEHRDS